MRQGVEGCKLCPWISKARRPQLAPDSGKMMYKKFIKMTKKGGEIPTIIEQWGLKQKELKKKDLEDKEIANISIDKQRNADLEKLTKMNGPFTSQPRSCGYLHGQKGCKGR